MFRHREQDINEDDDYADNADANADAVKTGDGDNDETVSSSRAAKLVQQGAAEAPLYRLQDILQQQQQQNETTTTTNNTPDYRMLFATTLPDDSDNTTKIELLESTSPDGPIGKFIEKKGEGMHHIAFAVPNTSEALDDISGKGVQLVDKVSRAGAEGLQIGFLHPRSTHGVLTELCSK